MLYVTTHLKTLLSSSDAMSIDRDIRESERDRIDRGLDPLSRHEIHELVLRQAREKAVEETKLRAVELSNHQTFYRLRNRRKRRPAEEEHAGERNSKKEERNCNLCGVKGHLAKSCPTPPSGSRPQPRGDRKRQPTVADDKSPTRPKLAMEDRLGERGVPGGRAGGLSTPRPVNSRNTHTTEGATCSHCGTKNHSAGLCTLNCALSRRGKQHSWRKSDGKARGQREQLKQNFVHEKKEAIATIQKGSTNKTKRMTKRQIWGAINTWRHKYTETMIYPNLSNTQTCLTSMIQL